MKDILREPPLCDQCGYNETWCVCPPPVYVNRPSREDTYPPLYCVVCTKPFFKAPMIKGHAAQYTCSDDCKKEMEHRYYLGPVLGLPYHSRKE